MPGSMRYQNPAVREHLASQYAMGLLTPSVKKRMEALLKQNPKLEKEVRQWQERLAPLNEVCEPVTPPDYVKRMRFLKIQLFT